MSVQDLVNKYNGKIFAITGPDQGQCTAVAHAWEQMLGLPIVYGNAKDTYTNADPVLYDKVLNIPDDLNNFPLAGAIVVWNEKWGGGYGHTAVVVSADGNTMQVLEQNDGNEGITHVGQHNYQDVTGWFIPKIIEGDTMSKDLLTKEEIQVANQLAFNDAEATDDLINAYVGKPLDGLLQQLQADPTRKTMVAKYRSVDGLIAKVNQLTETNAILAAELAKTPAPVIPVSEPVSIVKVPFFSTTAGRFWLNVIGTGLGFIVPYLTSLPIDPALTAFIGMISAKLIADIKNQSIPNSTTVVK